MDLDLYVMERNRKTPKNNFVHGQQQQQQDHFFQIYKIEKIYKCEKLLNIVITNQRSVMGIKERISGT